MKKLIVLTLTTVILFSCPALWAYTLTFDDISSGSELSYYSAHYDVIFQQSRWESTDGSTLDWVQPHSSPNVAIWTGPSGGLASILFGYVDDGELIFKPVHSIAAYFSTDTAVVVRMKLYFCGYPYEITRTIGDSDQWDNHYIEVLSPTGAAIEKVTFESVSSPDAINRFGIDDFTVTPVPEPASLAVLGAGLAPLVLKLRRRRS
jgi:hypothetical protein